MEKVLNSPIENKKYGKLLLSGCLGILILLAFWISSSSRGMYGGDLSRFVHWADEIHAGYGLEGREASDLANNKSMASVLYPFFIAIAYHLVGRTLLALHLFPFILAVATPLLFFFLLKRLLGDLLWSFMGTLLYLFYSTYFIWMNQALSEPVFMFFLVLTMLLMEYARKRPWLLIFVGMSAALLCLARLFDGFFFAGLAGVAVFYQHRKRIPIKWFVLSALSFLLIHVAASVAFDYSFIEKYYAYFFQSATQDQYYARDVGESFFVKSSLLLRTKMLMRWHWGGIMAPLTLFLVLLGGLERFRKNSLYALCCFVGYSLFLIVAFRGTNVEPLLTRLGLKVVPSLVLLLVVGGKFASDIIRSFSLVKQKSWISPAFFLLFFLGFGSVAIVKNLQFKELISKIVPPASLWQIIEHNVVLPPEREDFTKDFRETIYKEVLGEFRPWYLNKKAKEAWDAGLPQAELEASDWSYRDDFSDGTQWKQEAFSFDGTSELWLEEHDGRLGAYPFGAEATLIYKFTFPQPVKRLVLGDIHTQWEPGDALRMWTSLDGKQWTLQHDYDVYYEDAYFYRVFEESVRGKREFYVKFYFYAGDAERGPVDNRGASLKNWFLAATWLDS